MQIIHLIFFTFAIKTMLSQNTTLTNYESIHLHNLPFPITFHSL